MFKSDVDSDSVTIGINKFSTLTQKISHIYNILVTEIVIMTIWGATSHYKYSLWLHFHFSAIGCCFLDAKLSIKSVVTYHVVYVSQIEIKKLYKLLSAKSSDVFVGHIAR